MRDMAYPIPENEAARLEALRQYEILDTAPEQELDDITRLAAFIADMPIATLTLIDEHRQWFKSKVGLDGSEGSREDAFCSHTIMGSDTMVVEDALKDERFATNHYVLNAPHIRFYAGAPLRTPEGHGLGSLCVIDRKPRSLDEKQLAALESLARLVMMKLEMRRVTQELASALANVKTLNSLLPICAYCKSVRDDEGYWKQVESYLKEHAEVSFTHGICPNCVQEHFSQYTTAVP